MEKELFPINPYTCWIKCSKKLKAIRKKNKRTSLNYIKKIKGNNKIFSPPYGNYNSFSKNVINILALNKIKYVFTTVGYRNNYNDKIFDRPFLLNSKNKHYLKGIINGNMFLIDRLLLRLKKKKIT